MSRWWGEYLFICNFFDFVFTFAGQLFLLSTSPVSERSQHSHSWYSANMFHPQWHTICTLIVNLYRQKMHRILHKQPLKRITSINHWYNEPIVCMYNAISIIKTWSIWNMIYTEIYRLGYMVLIIDIALYMHTIGSLYQWLIDVIRFNGYLCSILCVLDDKGWLLAGRLCAIGYGTYLCRTSIGNVDNVQQ